jgi:hypothetical protein
MGEELHKLFRRRQALDRIRQLGRQHQNVLICHYSCESFYDRSDGSTPRVTSIAVRNLASGQTDSFSIHKIAEYQNLKSEKIVEYYDELEGEMLDEFFDFLRRNEKNTWVHWNMRDINYGFQAIEHRSRVLGGTPIHLPEERKFDLARALIDIYGKNYIEHPRLEKLVRKNHITYTSFLTGSEEASAFEKREFVRLHQSTLRKVHVIATILELVLQGSLKTNAKWYQIYGFHPKAIIEMVNEHWIWSLVVIVATVITILTVFL